MMFDVTTHNGTITALNPNTGDHRTFRIRTQPADAKFAPGERVVALLTGPDNQHSYTGFGFVTERGDVAVWRSKRGQQTPSVWEKYAGILEDPQAAADKWGLEYNFEGRCRVCNRALTTPDSVASGIGPVCAGKTSAAA